MYIEEAYAFHDLCLSGGDACVFVRLACVARVVRDHVLLEAHHVVHAEILPLAVAYRHTYNTSCYVSEPSKVLSLYIK